MLDNILGNTDGRLMIKIDVEGFELNVLRGAVDTLKRTKYLMIEIRDENRRDVFSFLRHKGFRLWDIHGINYLWVKA